MWSKVSVSLIKKQVLSIRETFHAGKSFWKIYLLKVHDYMNVVLFVFLFLRNDF